jgi:hypothetical protein
MTRTMQANDVVSALGLPTSALVDLRVPKTLLVENGAPTPADKRQIQDGIEELRWVASLKPTTIGVPAFVDAVREYGEVAVLTMTLRADARRSRLAELVHRAVPYPVFLVTELGPDPSISLAHKRRSEGKADATVIDGKVVEASLTPTSEAAHLCLTALALAQQPRRSLHATYQGWIDTILALQASQLTGSYKPAPSPELAAGRAAALEEISRLEATIASLRSAAAKEKQLSRQVQLNLELRRLLDSLAAARAQL